MNPIPIEYRSLLQYNEQWQALICVQCNGGSAVGREGLNRHLRDIHGLKAKDYNPLLASLDSSRLSILQSLEQFPRPLDNSDPIEGLRISKGLKCLHCGFSTPSSGVMDKHISKERKDMKEQGMASAPTHPGVQTVSLQIWSVHGWNRGYWTVIDPNDSFDTSVSMELTNGETQLSWLDQMVQKERHRLQAQEDNVLQITERHQKDDTSCWLMRTGWPALFSGKDIILIGETRLLRTKNGRVLEPSYIGVSELLTLNRAMDRIMEWAMDTLNSTAWEVRCWLKSSKVKESDSRPFKLPDLHPRRKHTCISDDRPIRLLDLRHHAQKRRCVPVWRRRSLPAGGRHILKI